MPAPRKRKLTAPHYTQAEVRAILKDRCPECDSPDHIESVLDEEDYVDDEEHVFFNGKPTFLPYKDYTCGRCGCTYRTYLGPVAAAILKEADIDV